MRYAAIIVGVLFAVAAQAQSTNDLVHRFANPQWPVPNRVDQNGDTLVAHKDYRYMPNMPMIDNSPYEIIWKRKDDEPANITKGELKAILRRLDELEKPERLRQWKIKNGQIKYGPE